MMQPAIPRKPAVIDPALNASWLLSAKKIRSVVFSLRQAIKSTAMEMAGMYFPANLKNADGSLL